jgi:hypothetical protein
MRKRGEHFILKRAHAPGGAPPPSSTCPGLRCESASAALERVGQKIQALLTPEKSRMSRFENRLIEEMR